MICDESPRRDTGQECRTNATGVPAPKPGYFTNHRLRRAIGMHLLKLLWAQGAPPVLDVAAKYACGRLPRARLVALFDVGA